MSILLPLHDSRLGKFVSVPIQFGIGFVAGVMLFSVSAQSDDLELGALSKPVAVQSNRGSHSEFNPQWNAEGTHLLYHFLPKEGEPEIRVVEVRSESGARRLDIQRVEDPMDLSAGVSLAEADGSHTAMPYFASPREFAFSADALELSQLKAQPFPDFVPDPAGRGEAAFVYNYHGFRNIAFAAEAKSAQKSFSPLTQWTFDSHRPSWSPDGSRIAFYTSFNHLGKPGLWSIAVLEVDPASGPVQGATLADRVMVEDVLMDSTQGPEWSADGRYIFFVKKTDPSSVHPDPIHALNVKTGRTYWLPTQTQYNRQIRVSKSGVLAFQAMRGDRSRVFLLKTSF